MARVQVCSMSSGEFDVQVEDANRVRTHRVVVGANLLRDLAAPTTSGQQIVAAAFDVLASEGGLNAIPPLVELETYRKRRGFVDEIRRRIA
ncbi:MAG: hypothetical protein ABJC79_00175 [Acidimicrobiia bacterium]